MSTIKVVVSGAAGQIGYSLIPLIANGDVFGSQRVELRLLDVPFCIQALGGVVMEVQDGAYPLLDKIVATADLQEAFTDVDYAILVGGFPRKAGMERKELLGKNVAIFKEQGEALNKYASRNVKVLVVANPANTNCMIASHFAPDIPKKNFSALTRLDHNRALAQLALKANATIADVKNVTIWGNHSSTQYPDVNHGTIRGQPIRSTINDDAYLNTDFISTVQKRGAAIIEARKLSSAMSAANAVKDHLRSWIFGTPAGEWVSMAVISEGQYDMTAGLCYSYPVTCANGEWQVVSGLSVDAFSLDLMKKTEQELVEERNDAFECINTPASA